MRLYPRTVTWKTMSKEIGIKVQHNSPELCNDGACWAQLVLSAAFSGSYSFNHLLYKEWVTNDDKNCSIIPIKLKRYRKKWKNILFYVITVNIIGSFNNKEDCFMKWHFLVKHCNNIGFIYNTENVYILLYILFIYIYIFFFSSKLLFTKILVLCFYLELFWSSH